MSATPTSSPPRVRFSPETARRTVEKLLAWFDAEKRDLPWRKTRDPYAILVSEFMLQQTQVATAIPYYERFLKACPTLKALAESSEQDVLRLWAGLGYYSRARHLRAAARKIVEEYGGRVPARVGDLLFLPGVGKYMAGAVASIAFGAAVPALDANAIRVLCRLLALEGKPSSPPVRRGLEALAARLIPAKRPGDFNQALMELGARVCAAARALCEICPLRALCKAAARGNPLDYPTPVRKPETIEVEEACAVVRRKDGRYLVTRRPGDSGRYRNMWEFPHVALPEGGKKIGNDDAARELAKRLKEAFGIQIRVEEEWAEIRHQVTHHKIRKRVFLCAEAAGRGGRSGAAAKTAFANPEEDAPVRWATLEEIGQLPLGAPHKRILALLEESEAMTRSLGASPGLEPPRRPAEGKGARHGA